MVSVVHVSERGCQLHVSLLDGRAVPIDHRLSVPRGRTRRPRAAEGQRWKSFLRVVVIRAWASLLTTDDQRGRSPLATMHDLIAEDPRNAERIFPYIGGEEVNDSPTHTPSPLRDQLRRA